MDLYSDMLDISGTYLMAYRFCYFPVVVVFVLDRLVGVVNKTVKVIVKHMMQTLEYHFSKIGAYA